MDGGDKDWMTLPRCSEQYVNGEDDFLDKAFARATKEKKFVTNVKSVVLVIAIVEELCVII